MQETSNGRDDELVALCAADEVRPGIPYRANVEEIAYVVFNLHDRFYVTQNRCTHGPGMLSRGSVIGDEIECPFHRGRFHIPSGRATMAPCTEALKTWTAHVIDGTVFIDPMRSHQEPPAQADHPAAYNDADRRRGEL